MNKYIVCLVLALLCSSLRAQKLTVEGKQLYIPKDLQTMDLQADSSLWSYKRMDLTKDFAVFWQRGFGHDLSNPPKLEGHDMHVDLKNLEYRLERFYQFYKDTLQFIKPGSNADKYRMMVMLNYSLDGTAYGGDYDQIIGAFWVAPNRIHDEKLNCVAHELGHSFQFQVAGDKKSEEWKLDPSIEAIQSNRGSGEDNLVSWGGGFYEMTSQWMLWQVNPNWVSDEAYHWEAYSHLTYKAFLHLDNIYHSPYILEYWGTKHGLPFIADMYRQGKTEEDVVMTYKRMNHLTQDQFCDEMFDANRHIINFDYPRVWKETRKFACTLTSKLVDKGDGWHQIADGNAPENYGFNAIPLVVPEKNNYVKLQFKGLVGKNILEYKDKEGWRYGFVCVNSNGKSFYGKMSRKSKGTLTFKIPNGETISHLYLVVMWAPKIHLANPNENGKDAQWPYQVKFTGTIPLETNFK